jgi:hypothetical protein
MNASVVHPRQEVLGQQVRILPGAPSEQRLYKSAQCSHHYGTQPGSHVDLNTAAI